MENIIEFKGKYYNEYEQKSRIKSALQIYFKDRDCFTLPKPTVSESQLQIIDILENENLRQEFVNQLTIFRKKLLTKVKEKSVRGKKINGEILTFIIKSYIQSVNSGHAMNFETVWSNICKQECIYAFEESEKIYDKLINEKINFEDFSQENLKEIHDMAKDKSLETFKKRAWEGEISIEYESSLKRKIKEKFKYLLSKTGEENKTSLTIILENWTTSIDHKLKSKEISSIYEIEKEFDVIEKKVNEGFSNFLQKNEFLFFYKYKALYISSEHLIENSHYELTSIQKNYEETINKISSEKMQMQVNYEKKLSKLNTSLQSLKNENTDMLSQNKNLKDNYKYLKDEKDCVIKNLLEKLDETKNENIKFMNEIENKNLSNEEKSKEIFKKYMKENSDLMSEKKLLEQKLEQLTVQIDDSCKREKENVNDLKLQIKEQTNAMREITNRYEEKIHQFKKQIEEYKDKILDLESLIQNNEFISENEKTKNESKIEKLEKELILMMEKNKLINAEFDKEKEFYQNKIKLNETDFIKKNKHNLLIIEELEAKLKLGEEKGKNSIDFFQKEIAIIRQNNELLESQVNDLKTQLQEQKLFNDNIMTKLGNNYEEEYNQRVEELKIDLINDKKSLSEEFEKSKRNYLNQITTLNNKFSLQESSFDKERSMHVKEFAKLKESFDKLKKEYEISIQNTKTLGDTLK